VVHSITKLSHLDVVYGFNPITALDLIPFPTSFDFIHKEEVSKSKFIKDLHEKGQNQIQAQTEKVPNITTKARELGVLMRVT